MLFYNLSVYTFPIRELYEMKTSNSISDIVGIKVGHAQDLDAATGCTVILCEKGAVGGVSQRGGAPGTRETDLLRPMHLIETVHAVMLSGGSAYGLDAAGGAMQYLEERKIGIDTGTAIVPIVPTAIIYDLAVGNADTRPDKEMGYKACSSSSSQKPNQGNWGAGTGATVGKIFGMGQAMKGGFGTSSMDVGGGLVLAAAAVVNPFGDVVDYRNREILAGARGIKKLPIHIGEKGYFANTLSVMQTFIGKGILSFASRSNTVIGVIATNASLTKTEVNKLADCASNGIALAVQPSFTMLDGDTVFGLSAGDKKIDANILFAHAPFVFADAIINAVLEAEELGGLPAAKNHKLRKES